MATTLHHWKNGATYDATNGVRKLAENLRLDADAVIHRVWELAESVPECFARAVQRPDLKTAVSEKRRQEAGGKKGASQKTEVP